jgi:hypothetical protein
VEQSTVFLFLNAAPLFEEEKGAVLVALFLDTLHPCLEHRPGARAAFAADDDPIDTLEVDSAEVFEEWLDAQEPHLGFCGSEVLYAWDAVCLILDTDTPPNVGCGSGFTEFGAQEVFHAVRSFGEDLICVPVCAEHDGSYRDNVLVTYCLLEEVAHTVDENGPWRRPPQWLKKFVGHHPWVKTLFVRVTFDVAEAFGECFGVAVLAAGADFDAPAHRVPRCLGPFDFGVITHTFAFVPIVAYERDLIPRMTPPDLCGLAPAQVAGRVIAIAKSILFN